ncbi:MAG: hypothetical protein ACQ5SW_05580, partial [Sphaerochaetaceae bacterium]
MLFLILLFILLIFLILLVSKTAIIRDRHKILPANPTIPTDMGDESLLAKAIACKTISHANKDDTNWQEFSRLIALLQESFPLCSKHRVTAEEIGPYNLVYHFQGKDEEEAPSLLTAHLDVVGA